MVQNNIRLEVWALVTKWSNGQKDGICVVGERDPVSNVVISKKITGMKLSNEKTLLEICTSNGVNFNVVMSDYHWSENMRAAVYHWASGLIESNGWAAPLDYYDFIRMIDDILEAHSTITD